MVQDDVGQLVYGTGGLLWIVARAYASALLRMPTLLRERREINARRQISKQDWYRLFSRFKLDAIELSLKF